MKKNLLIALGMALVGIVAGRVSAPRLGLSGLAIGESSSAELQPRIQSQLSGDLTLTVIEQDGSGYRVRAELRGGQLHQNPALKTDVKSALAQPFYFTVEPDGEVRSFYFARNLPVEARHLLMTTATSLEASIPGGAQAAWHTTERDVSGTYEADYTASGNTVTRNKTAYVQPRMLEGLVPVDASTKYGVQSQTTFDLGPSGWPQSITSDESFDVDRHGKAQVVSSQVKATLTATASHPDQAAPMPLDQVESAATADLRTVAAQKLKGRTFDQIIADLEAKENTTRNQAMSQLTALFVLDPKAVDEATDVVLAGGHTDNFMHRILGSLSGAATPATQQALITILQKGSDQRQMDAAAALGMTPHPTAASAAALQQVWGQRSHVVNTTTTLALGNMARRMELTMKDPAGAKNVMTPVLEQLQRTNDAGERKVALEALGNWGSDEAFAALQPYLSSKDATERATAVRSLRFVKGSAGDAAVIAALGDGEKSVREAAAMTLQFRPVAPVLGAVDKMVKGEPNERIGLDVVLGLRARPAERSATEPLLRWMAENHPSQEVKKEAKKALGTT